MSLNLLMRRINTEYNYKYLRFNEFSGKVVNVFNNKGEHLGNLVYEKVGRHTHWCWCQEQYISMSPGCIEEIRMKQKELYREMRSSLRGMKQD